MLDKQLTPQYRGRFAPSPTGPLHFGSLIAALGSYLRAKQQGGLWLVRMEDLDPPRELQGAADNILFTLEKFGFEWDESVIYQSARSKAYHGALEQLSKDQRSYRCRCTRKQIAEQARQLGLAANVYPGTCRSAQHGDNHGAIRLLTLEQKIQFNDLLQGEYVQKIDQEVGDFVLQRADGLFAYQLAVVVDDAFQGITEVVRGSDLLDNTPRQIALQQALGMTTPHYLHLPVVVNEAGQKLSKQTYATALDCNNPVPALWHALALLGQNPDKHLLNEELSSLWLWAHEHWQIDRIPRKLTIPLSTG